MTGEEERKACTRCERDLPATAFAWHTKDVKRRSECKECFKALSRSWYERNRDRVRENTRAYRAAAPRDRTRERAAQNARRKTQREAERLFRPPPAPRPPTPKPPRPEPKPKVVQAEPPRVPTGVTADGCVHRWRIGSPDGPTSQGQCVHCGALRGFKNSTDDEHARAWAREAQVGRSRA